MRVLKEKKKKARKINLDESKIKKLLFLLEIKNKKKKVEIFPFSSVGGNIKKN